MTWPYIWIVFPVVGLLIGIWYLFIRASTSSTFNTQTLWRPVPSNIASPQLVSAAPRAIPEEIERYSVNRSAAVVRFDTGTITPIMKSNNMSIIEFRRGPDAYSLIRDGNIIVDANSGVHDEGKIMPLRERYIASLLNDDDINRELKIKSIQTITALRKEWISKTPNPSTALPPRDSWVNSRLSEMGERYSISSNSIATAVDFNDITLSFLFYTSTSSERL